MIELDELDYKIMKVLVNDGQISNVRLSKMFGTSINTVRNHIQRMRELGILQVTGVTTSRLLGFDIHVILWLDVKPNLRNSIAETFISMRNVRHVTLTTGKHDLNVTAFFLTMEDYQIWMENKVEMIEGVISIKTNFIGEVIKRTYDYLPALEEMENKGFPKKLMEFDRYDNEKAIN